MRVEMLAMRQTLLVLLILLALGGPILAEPANLEGGWTLTETGKELTRHLFFSPGGPNWSAISNGKLMVTLDLKPANEENTWTGKLKEWEEHEVKVTLTDPNHLVLREIDGKRSWSMGRKK